MRIAALSLLVVAACGLHVVEDDQVQKSCSNPPPPGTCDCSNGTWWCSTCGFGEGTQPVPCSHPGDSCQIETWEHGCACSCGSDGYWSCSAETIGSQCPHDQFHDAGIDAPPDAPVDAT